MKVIHTWTNSDNTIPKNIAYGQMLSALLAKKHYGNIHLYTTKKLAEKIKRLGVPYDSINTSVLAPEGDITTFSIPKIEVFKDQKEEFLHIDLDTYIYDKIDFTQYNSPAVFSHPDLGVRPITMPFDFIVSGLLNKFNRPLIEWWDEEGNCESVFSYMTEFYVKPYLKFIDTTPVELIKHINFSSIPNMNIVHIKERAVEDFIASCNAALKQYQLHREEIDKLKYGPCYVEQFYLHSMMLGLNPEYREACSGIDIPRNVVFPQLPFNDIDIKNGVLNSADLLKKTDKGYEIVREVFYTEEERRKFYSSNMHGFFHSTFTTHRDYTQAHIINRIVNLFGEQYALSVHNGLDIDLSSGESKYMELFDHNLFS